MRLGGVSGSQLLGARVPVEAQYWNGTFWITNGDDNCTTLAAGNIGLGNYIGNLNAGETMATITASPLQAGRTGIQLSAPGAANNGSVDVALNLGAGAAANACPAFVPTATAGNRAYLRGKWCGATATRDPVARARFGIRRSSDEEIYTRETTN
jgi:MSHA biogenesis protein MshQ